MKDDELARNRATARTMLSDLHNLVVSASTDEDWARLRGAGDDPDIFVDLAGLWQEESLEKAVGAYQTAVSINSDAKVEGKPVDLREVRMSSNLGALFQLQGNVETAERMYQEALQALAAENGKDAEVLKTVLAYNLARSYEEGGDVLRQHPEHMECESS
jgi:RNA polymerase-associated protein CTR9